MARRRSGGQDTKVFRVFISHSSKDRDQANRLCDLLESSGVECWIAPRNVTPGEPYGAQIVRALERCDALVFLLSANSNESRHVESEVARAFEKDKDIYPVRLADVKPSENLELFVTSPHWIEEWQQGMETSARELVAAIRAGPRRKTVLPGSSAALPGPGRLFPLLVLFAAAAASILTFRIVRNPAEIERIRSRLLGRLPADANPPAVPIQPAASEPTAQPPIDTGPVTDVPASDSSGSTTDAGERPPTAGHPAAFVFRTFNTSDPELEFVWIAAAGVWAGRTEVSNRQYRRYKPDHWAGRFRGEDLDADSQPVVRVSAGDAAGFADWLTERERSAGHRPSPCRYRLPTADEWTTIAECGDKRAFPWGNRWPPAYGNYADSTLGGLAWGWSYAADYRDGHAVSASVIECGENPWRLYGTAGNVWEWTLETRDAKQAARGGAWDSYDEEALTCAARLMLAPDSREPMVGFRLVCDAPPPAP